LPGWLASVGLFGASHRIKRLIEDNIPFDDAMTLH